MMKTGGYAGRDGIENFEEREAERSRETATTQPLAKDVLQLVAELTPELPGVSQQCRAIERRKSCGSHRFDSGSSRCPRAASTWSARRLASAFAV